MKSVKFLVIGDPHGSKKLLKLDTSGYDAAIITGDMGKTDIMRGLAWGRKTASKKTIMKSYMDYVSTALPVLSHISEKIPTFCVHGNAELSDDDIMEVNRHTKSDIPLFEKRLETMPRQLFIDYAAVKFNGITIAGIGHFLETRWVREFSDCRLERLLLAAIEEGLAKQFFERVGEVDILLSHQPPYGILDKVGARYRVPRNWKGRHAGSLLLLEYIKKYQPRYVICGHIHEGRGVMKVGRTTVINAGCCGDWQNLVVRK